MSSIRNFFDVNHELVLFMYGLVFFVLGLAIAVQSRRHSRLTLGQSLRWLSLFGLTHGLHEWGLVFIPIQATYLSHASVVLMQIVQLLLLGFSFVALFQFGTSMLLEEWPWLQWSAPAVGAAWLATIAASAMFGDLPTGLWLEQSSIWARYMLCFPGGLLAAYGLRVQARRQILPLGLIPIFNIVRASGIAFVIYAFLSGLIGPAGSHFPANFLNQSLFVRWFGIPVPFFRSLTGLAMAWTIIRAMEVFDLEVDQLIERMEIEQSLLAERDRIGRELHDGAIQLVYSAGLILESARIKVADDAPVARRLDRATTVLNEAIASMRSYMSDLRAAPASATLVESLRSQAKDPRLNALIEVHLELPDQPVPVIRASRTAHVLAIVSEALANAARHGEARDAEIVLLDLGSEFSLRISDNGRGFDSSNPRSGYGLRNMKDRARLLGGSLALESQPGEGCTVTVTAPWEEM
jgi:signal transduction histidine kinase